ncbi:FMRFamide receptor-like [Tubulanus polymorphus]|uniref:FMRFamide receptor-like n=1 Tax=Tubulanus polymorphus TaxID=672921 RepID=UPI003DA3CB44
MTLSYWNNTAGLESIRYVSLLFNQYFPPVIIGLGVPANILAIIVLSSPRYRGLTTSFYLRFLSVFDTNLLAVVLLLSYLEDNRPELISNVFCKIYYTEDYFGFAISNSLLVVVTVDRFVAIQFPLKAKSWCTVKRARWVVLFVFIFVALCYSHLLIYGGSETPIYGGEPFCRLQLEGVWRDVFYMFDVIYSVYIPFPVLLILNILMARIVLKSRKQRESTSSGTKLHQREISLTILLLLVCFVFLVTSLPYVFHANFWESGNVDYENDPVLSELRRASSSISYVFLFINPMVNFYLYCLGSSKFRGEFKRLLRCWASSVR